MSTTTTTTTTSSLPLSSALHPRDVDEVSIASDFSVIPESLVEIEVGEDGRLTADRVAGGGRGGGGGGGVEEEEDADHLSTTSFLHSSDLRISSTAMETHSKVQFHKLQPNYYLDSDIPVTYSLGPQVSPISSDRIGLYKVGFGTIQDYVDYLWAPVPTTQQRVNNLPLTVVFRASSFQKEQNAGEFFQFCYVTHAGEIVGVSGPFQLLRVGAAGGQVCGVEEEEVGGAAGGGGEGGMVVIRSKESVLQERLVKLTQEREEQQTRVEEAEGRREELERKVEEQTQQLSLCQHHLQALEVKLKRETSEKCELMGRVGQVVEERGHLEERVRGVDRALASERAKNSHLDDALAKSEGRVRSLEEAALVSRKAEEELGIKVKGLEDNLSHTQLALKSTKEELGRVKGEWERAVKDLEFWTSNAEADQQERNSLALKYSTVTEELIGKQEELEESRKKSYSLEEKLTKALEELDSTKASHSSLTLEVEQLKEEQRVHLERENVVKADMAYLKERLAALEEEQRKDKSGRDAAETIACDLSSRLQAAKSEYQRLAVTNHKLVKKIKKMRVRGEASISSSGSIIETETETETETKKNKQENAQTNTADLTTSMISWICADAEEEEEEEEGEEEGVEVPASLSQSTLTTLTTPSCCSHTTQQLSEVVNQKMENIVRELSQQILSLKHQLEEKERVGRVEEDVDAKERDAGRRGETVERVEGEGEEGEQPEVRGQTSITAGPVLYGKSFLPTAPTAPVFLPERPRHTPMGGNPPSTPHAGNTPPTPTTTPTTQPNATLTTPTRQTPPTSVSPPSLVSPPGQPHPVDPTPAPRAHYYLPSHPSHPSQPRHVATSLPPPLLPESTATSRQAAVLSQFTQRTTTSSSSSSSSTLPTAPPLLSSLPHDSDDDDFHSTDSDTPSASPPPPAATTTTAATSAATPATASSQPQQIPQQGQRPQGEQQRGCPSPRVSPGSSPNSPALLDCPLCSLCFPLGTLRLLEEHINSHLEHVCPVCSQVFQRNSRDKFEEHVQAHFAEEEEERAVEEQHPRDNAGPWGELRGGHLLEID